MNTPAGSRSEYYRNLASFIIVFISCAAMILCQFLPFQITKNNFYHGTGRDRIYSLKGTDFIVKNNDEHMSTWLGGSKTILFIAEFLVIACAVSAIIFLVTAMIANRNNGFNTRVPLIASFVMFFCGVINFAEWAGLVSVPADIWETESYAWISALIQLVLFVTVLLLRYLPKSFSVPAAEPERRINTVPQYHAASQTPRNFCPACGTKLVNGLNFCPGCGANQNELN